jgi:hypothetical protein
MHTKLLNQSYEYFNASSSADTSCEAQVKGVECGAGGGGALEYRASSCLGARS